MGLFHKKPYILITGWAGYIGSHAAVAFLEAGFEVVIVDNLWNSSSTVIKQIERIAKKRPMFVRADLRDRAILESLFQTYPFEWVIHFAGLKAVGESCKFPLSYYDNNISGSIALFECMERFGVKNIVFSSSATVYSKNNPLPWKENGLLESTNAYGDTKRMTENMLERLSELKALNVICLRYFNPIGSHPSGLIGDNPRGVPDNLLPYILQVAQGHLQQVSVFGWDYPTVDGSAVRDYLHVMDLIEWHVKAYRFLQKQLHANGWFDCINLGTGKGTSVLQMIDMVKKVTQKDIPYKITPRRSGDLAEFYCDPTKAKVLLGWKTEKTVQEAIKDAWKFQNEPSRLSTRQWMVSLIKNRYSNRFSFLERSGFFRFPIHDSWLQEAKKWEDTTEKMKEKFILLSTRMKKLSANIKKHK